MKGINLITETRFLPPSSEKALSALIGRLLWPDQAPPPTILHQLSELKTQENVELDTK